MKRKVMVIVLALCLCLTGLAFRAVPAQAASAAVYVGSDTCSIGDTVTLGISISGDAAIGAADVFISYDTNILECTGIYVPSPGSGSYGGGSAQISWYGSETAIHCSITFRAVGTGTGSVFASASGAFDDGNYTTVTFSSGSGSVTVNGGSSASSEARLSSLQVGPGGLWPSFDPDTYEYYSTVSEDTTQLVISASVMDSDATYYVSGTNLSIGSNTSYVVVTAANGDQRTYWIYTTREGEESSSDSSESSSESSSENTEEITVTVNGKTKYVAGSLEEIDLPEGFHAGTTTYQGKTVAAAVRDKGNLKLLYLTEESLERPEETENDENSGSEERVVEGDWYIFDDKNQWLYPYETMREPEGELTFLEIGAETVIPEGYTKTTTKIGNKDYTTYAHPDQKELVLVYMLNADGTPGWYQYDPKEGTFQRYVPREEKVVETGPSEEELARMESLQAENASLQEQLDNAVTEVALYQRNMEAASNSVAQAQADQNYIRIIAIAMTGLCLLELIVFFVISAVNRNKRKKRRLERQERQREKNNYDEY